MPSRNAKSVFFEALEQESPEKLIQFLDAACAGDADLRSRLDEARILTDLAQTLLFSSTSNAGLTEPENMVRTAIQNYRNRGEATTELANALCVLGWILNFKTSNMELLASDNEGEMACREGLQIVEKYTDKRSLTVKGKLFVGLAFELLRRSDPSVLNEAGDFAERGLQLLRTHGPHDRFMSLALKASGKYQIQSGRADEAESSFRDAIAIEQRATGTVNVATLQHLISAMFQQGKIRDALELARSSNTRRGTPLPPGYVLSQTIVGCVLFGIGDVEGAEEQFRQARDEGVNHLGKEHFATIEASFWLARALAQQDDGTKQARAHELFTALLPIGRAVAETGADERFSNGYTCVVGSLASPTLADMELALEVNRRVLEQPLLPLFRLRNLHAGALVRIQSGDTEGALPFLREIIESPVAYGWSEIAGDSPFFVLRNAEDLLARMLLESGDNVAAEQVYRHAILRREEAAHLDQYQTIIAKQRLARFLLQQGNRDEARELLAAARDALRDAPECFDWLRDRIHEGLRAAEK